MFASSSQSQLRRLMEFKVQYFPTKNKAERKWNEIGAGCVNKFWERLLLKMDKISFWVTMDKMLKL